MKSRFAVLITLSISVIFISALFTFQVFSYYKKRTEPVEQNPVYSLIFPDQKYIISKRDLDTTDRELVIPTLDKITPKISYNAEVGILESVIAPQDYVVDLEALRLQVASYSDDTSLSFVPTYTLRSHSALSISDYNQRLNKIYRNPLNISLKDGSVLTDLAIEPSILRSVIVPTSTEINVPPFIRKAELIEYITTRLTPKQKKYFNADVAYENTRKAINLRFMGEATPVVLGVDDGPSSKGELAVKYLEVDLSQQKMYFFINNVLFKEYKISTGIDYPTPVGDFHILNKEPKAFSSIYNVWMPYWMAFKYAGDVKAYLGLHEIAYAVDAKGKPFYKHGYYIGDMMTGGCVAMEPKDSREIYNLSYIGMLVRIVK